MTAVATLTFAVAERDDAERRLALTLRARDRAFAPAGGFERARSAVEIAGGTEVVDLGTSQAVGTIIYAAALAAAGELQLVAQIHAGAWPRARTVRHGRLALYDVGDGELSPGLLLLGRRPGCAEPVVAGEVPGAPAAILKTDEDFAAARALLRAVEALPIAEGAT